MTDVPPPAGTDIAAMPWIERLIAFDTTSRNSNLGLIETVRDHLRSLGVEPVLTYHASGTKANMFATLPAHDGSTTGGIVLSGHTDVVPVDGQAWNSDPFKATTRDGKLYARGACDMKGFIGTALSLLPEMQATRLARPLHLALSFDEEVGCAGAPLMIMDLQARGVLPEGCIIGEPTGMRPVVAHKGINLYRCHVHGHAVHSSLTPQGVNAIEYAARMICFIRDLADKYRAEGPYDQHFEVPFTTAQTGMISGGIANNVVPSLCEFSFQVRNLPTVNVGEIIRQIQSYAHDVLVPRMRDEHPDARIEFSKISVAPALDDAQEGAITERVRALTQDHDKRKVSYGTEAGLFKAVGIPAVICGPGDIEQAHKADEFVALDQLRECALFLRRFVRGMAVAE
ncbi:acetylornithine deacetylase [Verminephrobacter aporrectodeae subsp. tuberculatae]|nr:acetylornithine deacetylase [Verminephrobacter aporrectodeae]MCW8198136.1 acetylornithine deacetylase [Verminephrobacter aporrectodeae subsp. tuberculatae]